MRVVYVLTHAAQNSPSRLPRNAVGRSAVEGCR
jgi:hypothetical protein